MTMNGAPAPKLHVALDATLWDEPTTGIALYMRRLMGALEAREGVRISRMGARRTGEHPRFDVGRTSFIIGQLPKLLADLGAPLCHGVCNFNLPLTRVRGTRFVLTVHDVIPLVVPRSVSPAFRWQFRAGRAAVCQLADRVICVSETTRRDLMARFTVDAEKLEVIPNGVDHVDEVPAPDAIGEAYLRALALPERYVLYAGALDARKNVGAVLDACELASPERRPGDARGRRAAVVRVRGHRAADGASALGRARRADAGVPAARCSTR